MHVFEFNEMLIEIVILYPASEDPVTLECADLRSEQLFAMYRADSGKLVLEAWSERIPVDLIAHVSTLAEERL